MVVLAKNQETQEIVSAHPNWTTVVQPRFRSLRFDDRRPGYDGIIARATAPLAEEAARAGLPLVNVWSGSPAKGLPSVLPDFAATGRMAAEHFLQRGLRRFAFHGFLHHVGSAQALAGFKAALRAAKCRPTSLIVSSKCDETDKSWRRYRERLERWIMGWKPPLAVMATLDIFCRYVADACLHRGLRIPDDVALIGLGNEPLTCTRPEPSLSSFDLGYERIGYEAAALLDRLMDGKPAPQAPIRLEPKELVLRRSTDIYVVNNPLVAAALRFIAEHSHEGIRVEDVAAHARATVRSLERHFREALGRTMMDEIARLRLERAKRLLVESDEPIKHVANNCGFGTLRHFHWAFLQAEGMTPGEYRRQRSGK